MMLREILFSALIGCSLSTHVHADVSATMTPKPMSTPVQAESPTPTIAEVPPDPSLPCFAGAYYRKAVSSTDLWDGIEGEITLPEIEFDPARWDDVRKRYLDNPSVYMGGRSGTQEIDCGLTWSPVKDEQGQISTEGRAFRPFWRNETWNMAPLDPNLYFHPGDKLRMRCEMTGAGKMAMVLTLVSRKSGGVPTVAPAPFRVEFDAVSFGPNTMQQFKRVNAIDQVKNEGKPAAATNTRVVGARWENVFLIRNGQKLPFNRARFTDMRCPVPKKVEAEALQGDGTAETITIDGGN